VFSKWKLLVLSGSLKGRELRLPEGEFTIGSKDSDLAVLLQNDVQSTLLVSSEEVLIKEDSTPLWYQGEKQVNPSPIPPSTVIDLAGFCFVLGVEEQNLSLEEIPKRQKHTRKREARNWLAISLFTLTLLFASLLVYLGWLAYKAPKVPPFDPKAWLQSQTNLEQYRDLHLSWSENGIVTVGGYCTDSKSYQALLGKLTSFGMHYSNEAICQDDIIHNVYFVLQQNGYSHVVVHSGEEPGTIIIAGDIYADKLWEKVSRVIAQVKGLKSWEVKSEKEKEKGMGGLLDALKENHLLDELSLSRHGQTTTITGHLSAEKEKQLKQILANNLKHDSSNRVIYQNIPVSQSMLSLFPASIRSFGGNAKKPYLILANGMRIEIGTQLPNGYQVTNLDPSGVELVKNGQILHIPLNI